MPKIHYAWVIACAGLVLTAAAIGMAVNCFSLFVVPVCSDMGFSRWQMGVCQTINALTFAVTALISGWLFQRVRLHSIMKVSAVTMAAAYFLYSRATRLWMFYACAVIGSTSASFLTWVPLSVILNNWFYKKRAFAIGFAFMGSGVGGMIFSSVGSRLIETVGWRSTFTVISAALFVIAVPIVYFVLSVRPQDRGLNAYGADGQTEKSALNGADGVRLSDAAKTMRFFGILLFIFAFGFATNGFTATFVPHLEDSGYDRIRAGELYSVYMLMLAAGKMTIGALFDRFGAKKTTALGLMLMLIALAGLIYARYVWAVIVMLAVAGIGNCLSTVGLPVLARSMYGDKDYAAFTGIFNTAGNLGCTLAPAALGLFRDHALSYSPGYACIMVLLMLTGVFAVGSIPIRNSEKR